jgi:hypothetical protein
MPGLGRVLPWVAAFWVLLIGAAVEWLTPEIAAGPKPLTDMLILVTIGLVARVADCYRSVWRRQP